MVFYRTRAVLDKTVKDLTKLTFWVFVLGQFLILGFDAYKIHSSIDRIVYLSIYCISTFICLCALIFFLASYRYRKGSKVKHTKLGFRFSKYTINLITIGVSIADIISGNVTQIGLILTVLSVLLVVAQLAIEAFRLIFDKYSSLLIIAIKKDADPYIETFNKVAHPKEALYKYFENRTQNKIDELTPQDESIFEEEDVNNKEQYVEELANSYKENKEDVR